MDKKGVGVVGIIIESREKLAPKVNELLTVYGDMIVGRMRIPYHRRGVM